MSTTVNINVQGSTSPYSRLIAFLLCFFLGLFGAHRFYVGKSGSGVAILFLTFCTGLGPIWAFIDLIMILAGSFTDNYGRYLSSWDTEPTPSPPHVSVTTHAPPTTAPPPPPPQKQADEMFCNTCGALCKKHETFCRNCGTALQH